jgi:nucleoside-diphosphate-sugar epimerase
MTHRQPLPTVLILGANGRFGVAAAQAFHADGWRVVAALRRAPAAGLPPGVRVVRTPIGNLEQIARDAAGAHIVVYAVNPPYTRWNKDLLPLARAGMDVAQRLGARLLLPGNVYNFGSTMPACLHEQTPQRADTRKGALRVQLEAEMAQRCAQGLLQATVVRAGDFFGGGTGSWFDQAIVKSLRAGRLVYPGPTGLPHAWAYLPDLASAFVAVAHRAPDACQAFERFHFAGHTVTGTGLLDGITQAADALGLQPGKPWSRAGMPWGLIRAGGLLVPMWRELAELAYLWRVPHALAGGALEAAAGPLRCTPLPDALRETLPGLDLGMRRQLAALATRSHIG